MSTDNTDRPAERVNLVREGNTVYRALIKVAGESREYADGNGIDRALYGYVVDMFELEFMHFAVFNIADIVINVCCILFVLLMLLRREPEKPEQT